jgi:hypothetical protein
MKSFGKCKGGGRRRAAREVLPMAALVNTLEKTWITVLLDVSATGARLRGFDLPAAGEALLVTMDCVRAFGIVAWSEHDECGVQFDPPLPVFEVDRLRREVKVATLTLNVAEEQRAIHAWATGMAR